MALVSSISFNKGYGDIHLLRGRQVTLRTKLVFTLDNGNAVWGHDYVAGHAGITIEYKAPFNFNAGTHLFTSNGVEMDTRTGRIRAVPYAGTNPVENFIITVTVSGANVQNGPLTKRIRIHIHEAVVNTWMTPSPLTIHKGAVVDAAHPTRTGMRLSVYAEFNDGVIGDLSNYAGFTDVTNNIQWAPAARVVNDVNDGGIILLKATDVPGTNDVVTATLPASIGGGNVQGNITVGAEWTSSGNTPVSLVPSTGPGYASRNEMMNILFIGDGFRNQAPEFNSAINEFVDALRNEAALRPYDLLVPSMNFWSAYTDSPQAGISILSEVFISSAAPLQVTEVPFPKVDAALTPTNNSAAWDIQDLITYVGLPVARHDPANAALTNAIIRTEWADKIKLDPVAATNTGFFNAILDPLVDQWRGMFQRRLLNERDTMFGIMIGKKPTAQVDANLTTTLVGTNDDKRIQRGRQMEGFFSSLKDGAANVYNGIWNPTTPDIFPKDYDLVVMLLNANCGRANNPFGLLYTKLTNEALFDTTNIDAVAAGGASPLALDLVPPVPTAPPNSLPASSKRTLVHELSHSLGLGDEYAEDLTTPYFQLPRPQLPDDPEEELSIYSNLQSNAELRNGVGTIDALKIRWRWHRIAKAGALRNPSVDNGDGTFTLTLRSGHAAAFANNDLVLLRLRLPLGYTSDELTVAPGGYNAAGHFIEVTASAGSFVTLNILKLFAYTSEVIPAVGTTPAKSQIKGPITEPVPNRFRIILREGHSTYAAGNRIKLKLKEPSSLNPDHFISPELRITEAPNNDFIRVRADAGAVNFDVIRQFLPGSVLYSPVLINPLVQAPGFKYAELVAKNVFDAMNNSEPLTGDPCVIAANDVELQRQANNRFATILFPAGTQRPIFAAGLPITQSRIIGLYNGGDRFHCGVYHPTGFCMMRRHDFAAVEFCPVCQYIMIDIIDPSKHSVIDTRQIKRFYPIKDIGEP